MGEGKQGRDPMIVCKLPQVMDQRGAGIACQPFDASLWHEIIRLVGLVEIAGDRINGCLNALRTEQCQQFVIKVSHRARDQRHNARGTGAGEKHELVMDEIKIDLKGRSTRGERASGHAARRDEERHMPPMVERGM